MFFSSNLDMYKDHITNIALKSIMWIMLIHRQNSTVLASRQFKRLQVCCLHLSSGLETIMHGWGGGKLQPNSVFLIILDDEELGPDCAQAESSNKGSFTKAPQAFSVCLDFFWPSSLVTCILCTHKSSFSTVSCVGFTSTIFSLVSLHMFFFFFAKYPDILKHLAVWYCL